MKLSPENQNRLDIWTSKLLDAPYNFEELERIADKDSAYSFSHKHGASFILEMCLEEPKGFFLSKVWSVWDEKRQTAFVWILEDINKNGWIFPE
jgi:hypothetical protein